MNSSFNQLFMATMTNHATLIMNKIVESYKGFENINKLVDVGGGLGVTLNIITSKYPHIKGINFDLPHAIEHASPSPRTISNSQIQFKIMFDECCKRKKKNPKKEVNGTYIIQ